MNENFVYDEFNPKMKGGRASGITEIFQATNSYQQTPTSKTISRHFFALHLFISCL